MNKFYAILTLLIVAKVSLAAEIYKCSIDGKITYSQMPCAIEELEERLYKLEKIQPIAEKKSTRFTQANTILNPNKANNDNSQEKVKIYILNNKINRSYNEIDKYQRKMRSEIKIIKNKTYYATNNNAGANYLNALSNEMAAVSEKYKVYIDIERDSIKGFKEEIASLKNN